MKQARTIPLQLLLFFSLGTCSVAGLARAEDTTAEPAKPSEQLKKILARFPQSDANADGILTRSEAIAFFQARREKSSTGDGPMRQAKKKGAASDPAHADIAYGDHAKQTFDLWLPPGVTEPSPVVLFIHGGGFRSGDKSAVPQKVVDQYLDAGVAFAAINYRLSDVGPYPIMMNDCARALQTIRHRAAEWNLDPERIASYGGSAGAGISLWLGFHDDLADPDSSDPVSRQSTRVIAVGTMNGQSTCDINDFRDWFGIPDLRPGPALPAFYAVESEKDWDSDRVRKLMKEASSINHLTKDDVPVYMFYSRPNSPVTADTESSVWVHHVQLGLKLQEAMAEVGLECIVTSPDLVPADAPHRSLEEFLIAKLSK